MSYAFITLSLFGTIILINSTIFHASTNKCSVSFSQVGNNQITEGTLEQAFKTGDQNLEKRRELVERLAREGKVIWLNSRKSDLSLIRKDPHIHKMESVHLIFEEATKELNERFSFSRDAFTNELPNINVKSGLAGRRAIQCREQIMTPRCFPNSKYRRMDGQCNNLWNPRWGSARCCQRRLLPANYVGASGFRVSVSGEPLPEPRQLSLNVHYHKNRPADYVTHMYMFFGQLLDHDITQAPQSTTINNQAINCCPPEAVTHPQCAPILVSPNDPFYSRYNVTCINFVRSAICPTCTLGAREIMNQLTSFIDASFVYGNSEEQSRFLRKNDGTGRLRFQGSPFGDLLPKSSNPGNDECSFPQSNEICFEAGDARANEHTVLASLHTIFLRQHNRIAHGLKQLNPHWDDDKLFLEARRILGAQMQVITYKEYLPITLGDEKMSYYKLWPGSWSRYDPNEDPTTLIEFTTAAFRFGHTLINSIIANRPLNKFSQPRLLRDEFFQPFELYKGLMNTIVAGASNSPAQLFDRHLVPDVTGYLYRLRGNSTGLDLAAINIQRGRDHGLPTYVEAVRHCSEGQVVIKDFEDLERTDLMRKEQARLLSKNYRFVEDIDLWTGIVSEIYLEGAVVGPTAACIIGTQFYNLKYGDRYYYEHKNEAGSFTSKQLEELQKTTLSQIICLNTEIHGLPRNAMIFKSNENPYIECRSVTAIDLSFWKE